MHKCVDLWHRNISTYVIPLIFEYLQSPIKDRAVAICGRRDCKGANRRRLGRTVQRYDFDPKIVLASAIARHSWMRQPEDA